MSKLWNITAIAVVALLMLTMFISIASASDETTITITVSTKEGLPLKDAIVSLNGTIIGKTNSYGRITHTVSAANVTDSTICVYYVFDGHNLTISNCQSYGNATDIHITAEVVKSWPIRVWDHALRDPVPDANVTIALKSDPSLKFWKLTDQDGKAVFGIIPYEDFDVYVKYGEIYKTVESVKPTPISAYNKVEELNISLPLYRVTITVLDKKSSPVKDVNLQLKEDLEESPIASVKSGSDGKAVFKLIPRGSYYLTAYLKGVKVYESEDKEITITGDDVSKTIAVNAVKLNLTIYDYDGSDKITNYQLKGSLILNGVTVGETGSEDGVLRFGHTPFANYTLKITLGSLEVYSSPYLVNLENAEKSINAWFYDVVVEVNASSLVNATLTKSLKGTLTASTVKIDFQLKDGKAQLINVPRSTKYTVSLYYGERKVQEISGVKITREGQIVKLNLTGYKISIFTVNLAGEPVNTSISIILPGVGKIASFETDSKGRGVSGLLLPLSYEVEAFLDGILVGKQSLNLVSNAELHMKLSIMDVVFKILDKDGEAVLGNVSLKLVHGKFSRSGKSNSNNEIEIKNLPVETYRAIVHYYGFKVLDAPIEIEPGTAEVDLKALGVLDARLLFVDAMRKPLDQGSVIISFGDVSMEKNISRTGEVYLRNLPNTTLAVTVLYKKVKVSSIPKQFDLTRDELKVTFITSVYTLTARVLRGDGKDLDVGKALIYVNGILESSYDLKDGNLISERLPQGDLRIQITYRGRSAGSTEMYFEKSIEDLKIRSTIYPFTITIRDSNGKPVKEVKVKFVDNLGLVSEAESGSDGKAEVLLPIGKYTCYLNIGNNTYSFDLDFRETTSINFLYPSPAEHVFEAVVAAGAVDLAISGFALSKISRERPRRPRRRRPRAESRPTRRVPRV